MTIRQKQLRPYIAVALSVIVFVCLYSYFKNNYTKQLTWEIEEVIERLGEIENQQVTDTGSEIHLGSVVCSKQEQEIYQDYLPKVANLSDGLLNELLLVFDDCAYEDVWLLDSRVSRLRNEVEKLQILVNLQHNNKYQSDLETWQGVLELNETILQNRISLVASQKNIITHLLSEDKLSSFLVLDEKKSAEESKQAILEAKSELSSLLETDNI